MSLAITPESAHVLLIGAGGIGCPAAWALSVAGVGRVTLVDPDTIEVSNLPRQILYAPGDVGQLKAEVAAQRLGVGVRGVGVRLDEHSAPELLQAVDVLIDATDGARTKDWVNLLAVRRGLPLVHAAGLRGEGRVLAVRAGGRPCLACLFGRLQEEQGSCADLGVFNSVVAAVGVRAAQEALRLLGASPAAATTYEVLDLDVGRVVRLEVGADPLCPVCAKAGEMEPYPDSAACVPVESAAAQGNAPAASQWLDLREERCPLNLLRARQTLEELEPGTVLEILLGEEGAGTVPIGVRRLGHEVLHQEALIPEAQGSGALPHQAMGVAGRGKGQGARLIVRRGAFAQRSEPLPQRWLERFARQVVLPQVSEAGQWRLLGAKVHLVGADQALASAALLLVASGVGQLWVQGKGALPVAPGGAPLLAFLRERSAGEVHEGAPPADRGALRIPVRSDGEPTPLGRLLQGVHLAHAVQMALLRAP